MAILLGEPKAAACVNALSDNDHVLLSATTMAEALVVARARGIGEAMNRLLKGLGPEIVPATEATARSVAECYERWGKGVHPAGLNFADCFAYALAAERDCALLYVGEDFSRTDVRPALAG